ncbi:DNA (cytosine-5-)-methyltransferase [Fusobacterium necrophorum subsp. funduliforme ATCC 51357]|nr:MULTISPECIES: site-specific DNA-methyltransferase [Fusobacterium]EIJ72444.1 DNA (cytosine-5-)-methyltransferase [Fusobacterium necrophorum subsp. funduliforme ATCC 51357]KAB0552928.1 site-specific DNA-methyltransferase [Fusobacterium necrophorum subsp. funduliforme]
MKIMHGDCSEYLKTIKTESIDCIVTSPPYWQLRDYGVSNQIGMEESIEEYIDKLMNIMNELYRVLKKSGTFFLNLGDTYSNVNSKFYPANKMKDNKFSWIEGTVVSRKTNILRKSKMMIPERLSIRMIDSGWILRNEIIWHKPNALPESLTDRFTNDFEKIFFFTKSQKYYFQKQYEPYSEKTLHSFKDGIMPTGKKKMLSAGESKMAMKKIDKPWRAVYNEKGRNMRTVWSIANKGLREGHYASFPEKLVERCLLSGCPQNGIVLDPFLGSGTTLKVAKNLNLNGIGIELKKEYIDIAVHRIGEDLFTKIQIV